MGNKRRKGFDNWYKKEIAKRLLMEEEEVSMGTFIERWLRNDKGPNSKKPSDQSNTKTDK